MFVDPRVPDGISLRNFGIQTVSVPFTLFQIRKCGRDVCAWDECERCCAGMNDDRELSLGYVFD